MKKLNHLFNCLFLVLAIQACQNKKESSNQKVIATNTEEKTITNEEELGNKLLEKCIAAHGGLKIWNSFEAIEYVLNDKGREVYQITNLKDRRAYLKSDSYEVGFDGRVAWSVPNPAELPGHSAAFYYNLDFYFVGIPFLLKDPGVHVFYAGKKDIDNIAYDALKVTFGTGVGLTPDDVYYMYIHPETYILHILTYSVSYFNKENAGINTAKVYSEWKETQGLLIAQKMENFSWENETLGSSKNHLRIFKDIKFLNKVEDESIYEVPEGAQIEKLSK